MLEEHKEIQKNIISSSTVWVLHIQAKLVTLIRTRKVVKIIE